MTSEAAGDSQNYKNELRDIAKRVLKHELKTHDPETLFKNKDIKEVIFELQMHQIELELQNTELQKAHTEIEKARIKYYDFYDLSPIPYLSLDNQSIIREINLSGAVMLGLDRAILTNRPILPYLATESHEAFFSHNARVFESKDAQRVLIKLNPHKGTPFNAFVISKRIKDEATDRYRVSSAFINLSDIPLPS